MFARYENEFTRDVMSTDADWRERLPQAIGEHRWRFESEESAVISFSSQAQASLTITWHEIEPRRIALMSLPRLQVHFAFKNVGSATRDSFMARFDLYMQRGGG